MQTPDFLRTTALFSTLNGNELNLVARAMDDLFLPEGARPVEEGQPNNRLYVIFDGHVELKGMGTDGKERTLAILTSKDCFGESTLSPAAPSLVTAEVTLGDARLLAIPGDSIRRLIRLTPEIGVGLLVGAFARVQQLQRLAVLQS